MVSAPLGDSKVVSSHHANARNDSVSPLVPVVPRHAPVVTRRIRPRRHSFNRDTSLYRGD